MRILAFIALALLVQGCTVAQSAQYATARYCHLPSEIRTANREIVAYAVAPHRITIYCAGNE